MVNKRTFSAIFALALIAFACNPLFAQRDGFRKYWTIQIDGRQFGLRENMDGSLTYVYFGFEPVILRLSAYSLLAIGAGTIVSAIIAMAMIGQLSARRSTA